MRTWDDHRATICSEAAIFNWAREGNLEAVRELTLTRDVLEEKDSKGSSPLMLAVYNGHIELAGYLLNQGADPNSCDPAGNSILMGAAFKGYVALVQMLIEAGATVHARNGQSQGALDFASLFGRQEVVAYLRSLAH